MGIGCALGYHTGVQMLNKIVVNRKNATFNGLSLAGNTVGAILVFHFISQLLENQPYENSLVIMTGCIFGISMIFSFLYLVPQRHISHHMEKEVEKQGMYRVSHIITSPNFLLEIRVIMKIEYNPCYPRIYETFEQE